MFPRKLVLSLAALFLAAGLVPAGDEKKVEQKETAGKVKSVTESGFVLTDTNGKDWTFETGKGTVVMAKGATHTLDASPGGATKLADLLATDQEVAVKYKEKDGKMWAKHVHVK
jgi:hypothetical protein